MIPVTCATVMRTCSALIGVLVTAATISCASASAETEQRPSRPTRRDSFVISEEELGNSSTRNALEAVQRLRPQWLRARGRTSLGRAEPHPVMIYLNDLRVGGPAALAQLMTESVKEIRFYSAADATSRWGTDHTSGAIVVTMKSGGGR